MMEIKPKLLTLFWLPKVIIIKSYYKVDSENQSSIPHLMRKTKVRYLALAMAALLMFGNNYSFDNP